MASIRYHRATIMLLYTRNNFLTTAIPPLFVLCYIYSKICLCKRNGIPDRRVTMPVQAWSLQGNLYATCFILSTTHNKTVTCTFAQWGFVRRRTVFIKQQYQYSPLDAAYQSSML
jgi:hypothetical protein